MTTDVAKHDFWASINPASARYADWAGVFDEPRHVPITTPIATRVNLPVGEREVLFVRCDLLNDAERQRLAQHLADRFPNVSVDQVRQAIDQEPKTAVPILVEDVSVTVYHPARWL